ncbi:MAG: bifunctional DNA-formamidopyrimidine glycosylase/DNA-(apurinic or apyrimidinic site) lyase [Azospirillaceae bacterium]
MPELPEVETVRRGLQKKMEGRRLGRVEVRRPDLRFALPDDLAARLSGRQVVAIDRRAKYLLFRLDDGMVLMLHLGMSGRLVVSAATPGFLPGRHDHLIFETEDGSRIVFNDVRRFGMADLVSSNALGAHPLLAGLGPEPLDPASFTPGHLDRALAGRRTPIKAALLDQRVVAGLGNIYVAEALWEAGVSPRRLAATIPGKRAERLVPAIRQVLERAIAAGGSSLRDYVQADGELGYFQHEWRVYGRAGEACAGRRPGRTCGVPIRRIVQGGRSSFYCPACQR